MLKDKSVDTEVFSLLRKMKPLRQIEAVELMAAMNNFTARYAHALLAATRREDLARPDRPKNIRGLTAEQMTRVEREMDGLQREFKAVSTSYGDTGALRFVCGSFHGSAGASAGLQPVHRRVRDGRSESREGSSRRSAALAFDLANPVLEGGAGGGSIAENRRV
jgi:hypothetical protein